MAAKAKVKRTKPKTHKGLAKRVKVTATGKVKRYKGGKSHLLSNKSGNQRRSMKKSTVMLDSEGKKIIDQLTHS